MKNKDLCDHDPRCIMSCGLMCDDIIMDYMKRTQSPKIFKQGYDFVFPQMDTDMIFIYWGTFQDLEWKKGCYECIDMPCGHYSIKINEVKRLLGSCIN